MMKKIIQKIASNKLYLEYDEIIDISPDIIHMFKLKKDMDISDIYDDILYESIRQKAFYYIYLKSRTRYELLSKLKLKYKNNELINSVLDYLEDNDYINDIDYAISYILSHKNSKLKNTMKLMQKGKKKEDIDIAYEDIPDSDELDLLNNELEKLVSKSYEEAKIIIKLTRKGYRYTDITKALREIKSRD